MSIFAHFSKRRTADLSMNRSYKALVYVRLILGLQPRDKAAMLGVKTKEYFLEEFT